MTSPIRIACLAGDAAARKMAAPAQFGAMMLTNCVLGLNTPLVGSTQFVGCVIGGISVGTVMRTIWPFYGGLLWR